MAERKGHFGCLGELSTPPFQRLVEVSSPFAYAYAYVVDLQQLPKREYSAQICYYRRGGNLTIFDKDNDTVKRKQLEVLTAKHGRSLRLLCTVSGDQAKLNGVKKSLLALGGGWKLVVNKAVSVPGLAAKIKLSEPCQHSIEFR
jgi:hypothetical protein